MTSPASEVAPTQSSGKIHSTEISLEAKPFREHLILPKSPSVSSRHQGTTTTTTKGSFHLACLTTPNWICVQGSISIVGFKMCCIFGAMFYHGNTKEHIFLTLLLSQSCPNKWYALQEVLYFELTWQIFCPSENVEKLVLNWESTHLKILAHKELVFTQSRHSATINRDQKTCYQHPHISLKIMPTNQFTHYWGTAISFNSCFLNFHMHNR